MSEHKHHIVPIKTNITVFLALLFLTAATILVANYDLGKFNVFVALVIATVKASIVALWFMHLKYDDLTNRVVFIAGFFFLGLFYLLTALDVFWR